MAVHLLPDETLRAIRQMDWELAIMGIGIAQGVVKGHISQREAWKRYGKHVVERWVKSDLVHPKCDSAKRRLKLRYSVLELEAVAKSSHLYDMQTEEGRNDLQAAVRLALEGVSFDID